MDPNACASSIAETEQRAAVVYAASSWLGTPFHMNAAVKAVGVDCGRFPWLVLKECGLPVPTLPPFWPGDFMCNAMAEKEPYLSLVEMTMREVATPLPGDLALFRPMQSNCYCHAAIVVDWPRVIHARGIGVKPQVEAASADHWPFTRVPVRFFTVFPALDT